MIRERVIPEEVRRSELGGGPDGDRKSWRTSGGGSWEEVREEARLRGDGYEARLRGKVKRYG